MKGQYEIISPGNKEALEAVIADQTLESLNNTAKTYHTEAAIRHYTRNADDKIVSPESKKEHTLDRYFDNMALYVEEPILGHSKDGLNSTDAMENLNYLSNISVLDKTEVKTYKKALSKIHTLLGQLHIRNPDNFNSTLESKLPLGLAAIFGAGAISGACVSLVTSDENLRNIAGIASYLLGTASISIYIAHSPELSAYPVAHHQEGLSLRTKAELMRYENAVANHIQKHGMTFDKDLETAIQYGQKLQDSLRAARKTSRYDSVIIEIEHAQKYISWAISKLESMAERE